MGRPHLTVLPRWEDCDRCPRQEHRLGVFAPRWKKKPRVLVVHLKADRASQATRLHAPRVERFAAELAEAVSIPADDVQVDVLLACGLRAESSVDHVAACSARFLDNERSSGAPDVVVVVGVHANAAAESAGLIMRGEWHLVGSRTFVPVVVVDRPALDDDLVTTVAGRLGTSVRRTRRRGLRGPPIGPLLLDVLDEHRGCRRLDRDAGAWRTMNGQELSLGRVQSHLAGKSFVAPFMPSGAWKYVVVDIDRHNAIQADVFERTVRQVTALLPNSLVIQSSSGGGRHIYVRLPPQTEYAHAALWLRAFFSVRGLLFVDKAVRRDGKTVLVRAAAVEVPDQPVRLPFGHGSFIVGANKSIRQQVIDFVTFLNTSDWSDYENAKKAVMSALKLGPSESPQKRRKLQQVVEKGLVAGLRLKRLDPSDPWAPIIPRLKAVHRLEKNAALAVVASSGVPAMGTRTGWMNRLIDVLFELVEPDEVKRLMRWWLYEREHRSENIEIDIAGVEKEIIAAIETKKNKIGGVPKVIWAHVEGEVSSALRTVKGIPRQTRSGTPLNDADVKRTAFFLLRGFIERGVPERPIPAREFCRFVPEDLAPSVHLLLRAGSWFSLQSAAIIGVRAAVFKVDPALVRRPYPGEDTFFVPP